MAASTISQAMANDKAPIVDNLSSRMVAVETQMTGFDRRMSSVEGKLDMMTGKLQEFIEATNSISLRTGSYDPQKILQFLLMGATLLGIIASSIIYISNSQSAERQTSIEAQSRSASERLKFLEEAYITDMKTELLEWRKRYGWRGEIVSSR